MLVNLRKNKKRREVMTKYNGANTTAPPSISATLAQRSTQNGTANTIVAHRRVFMGGVNDLTLPTTATTTTGANKDQQVT
jgi:hypothetical protein